MPKGQNVIWCASFQLAWDRLGKDVVHAPPDVLHAEKVAERLNRNTFPESDVSADSYYAAAGWCRDGIVENIRQEMQRRFHHLPTIAEIDHPMNDIVAYGYLEVGIPFSVPYFENPAPLAFEDGAGKKTNVSSFGVNFSKPSTEQTPGLPLCQQVRVLHCAVDDRMRTTEFAIDPCRESSPNQVILARVPAEATLQATWKSLEKRMADYPRQRFAEPKFELDTLLVPNLAWDLTHHFAELEGFDKHLKNKGFENLFLLHAIQGICFRLDRSGAALRSEALLSPASGMPRTFIFDRPFFIFVRKRDRGVPFFALHVANAELLCKP
jgi:hypothetical protein